MRIAASVQSQAVFRACQLLGGPEQLAARIGVSRLLVKAILKGSLPTSHQLFLKVVDILAAADGYEAYDASTRDKQGQTRDISRGLRG